MHRRPFLRSIVGLVGLGFGEGCFRRIHPFPPFQGAVEQVRVLGETDGSTDVLYELTAEAVSVDARLSRLVDPASRATLSVSAAAETRLLERYDDVTYEVRLRAMAPRGRLTVDPPSTPTDPDPDAEGWVPGALYRFRTYRGTFADLLVGDRIEFVIDPIATDLLSGVNYLVRTGRVVEMRTTTDERGERLPVAVLAHDVGGERVRLPYEVPADLGSRLTVGDDLTFAVDLDADGEFRRIRTLDPKPYGRI